MPTRTLPWLTDVLAGVYVLRNVDEDRARAILRGAAPFYDGFSFGGFDFMVPGAAAEAWLLIGRWTDCFDPEVQAAAKGIESGLIRSAFLDNAGIRSGDKPGDMILSPSDAIVGDSRQRVEVAALHAYAGKLAIPWWEGDQRARLEAIFPSFPHWIGLHMGAHHWLGTGLRHEGARILSVTPYIRIDFVPGRGITLSAMAEPTAMEPWLEALCAATGWGLRLYGVEIAERSHGWWCSLLDADHTVTT